MKKLYTYFTSLILLISLTPIFATNITSPHSSPPVALKNTVSQGNGITWQKLADIEGGEMHGVTADPQNPSNLYVAVNHAGVYKSIDAGNTWNLLSSAIGDENSTEDIFFYKNNLYVLTMNNLYRSGDDGETWQQINLNQPSTSQFYMHSVQVSTDGTLYLSSVSYAGYSTDGTNWKWFTQPGNTVYVDAKNTIYLAGQNGNQTTLWYSANKGTTWGAITKGLPTQKVQALTGYNGKLFLAFSNYNGGSAVSMCDLTTSSCSNVSNGLDDFQINTFVQFNNKLYAGTGFNTQSMDANGGVFVWNGNSWQLPSQDFSSEFINNLEVINNKLFISTEASLYTSIDGVTWATANQGMSALQVDAISRLTDNTLLAGLDVGGIYISKDNGQTWQANNAGLDLQAGYASAQAFVDVPSQQKVYALFALSLYERAYNDSSWTLVQTPMVLVINVRDSVRSIAYDSNTNTIYIGTNGVSESNVYKSTDAGKSWQGIPMFQVGMPKALQLVMKQSLSTQNNILYGIFEDNMAYSYDVVSAKSWQPLSQNYPEDTAGISQITVDQANTDNLYMQTYNSDEMRQVRQIYKTIDYGNSWLPVPGQTGNLIANNNNLYVANVNGIYVSTDGGSTWTLNNTGLQNTHVTAFFNANNQSLYAATRSGIYQSSPLPSSSTN